MWFVIWCVCAALIAGQAAAGAWAREKGELFISQGGNFLLSDGAELPVHYDPTTYAEYGLTDRVTLGLDYHTADKGRIQTAFVFARVPLGDVDGRDRIAFSLGFGQRADVVNGAETLTRGGVSWGRGLESGWLAVDTSATFSASDGSARPKADFTWGRHLTDRWTASVQLQTGQGFNDDYYAKISPAISFGINERYRINVGAVQALTGDGGAALKVELWTTRWPFE